MDKQTSFTVFLAIAGMVMGVASLVFWVVRSLVEGQ